MISGATKYKSAKRLTIKVGQKHPTIKPRRSKEQIVADKARAKRARKARAKQRRR